VGVVLGIGIGMMYTVHNAIHLGTHVRGALGDIRVYVKDAFPEAVHGKGPMRSIAVMEKRLGKKR
jgi:hypothetical protein